MKFFFTFYFLLFTFLVSAQHKVMIIPFEPKLYMSQVDHRIHAETKLSQKEIREAFRRAVNAELAKAWKQHAEVTDLMKDTVKTKKDILNIYKNITFKYEKVPDQNNYKAPAEEKIKKQDNIKNGQLVVETSPEARFMNASVTSPALIPGLYAKFKTDLFLFVNELDILSTPMATDVASVSERTLSIHYTVFLVDAKEINSGICSVKFPSDANSISKISVYLNKAAVEITRRINGCLAKAQPKK